MLIKAKDGFVLSGDSRIVNKQDSKYSPLEKLTYKVFKCKNNCGIASCGDACFLKQPIESLMNKFAKEKIKADTLISSVPNMLIEFFNDPNLDFEAEFLVCGYQYMYANSNFTEHAYSISFKKGEKPQIQEYDLAVQQLFACGVPTYVNRYISPAIILPSSYYKNKDIIDDFDKIEKILCCDNENRNKVCLVPPLCDFKSMFLTDAVEVAKILMGLTVKMLHINNQPEVVGEPFDILVVKRGEAFWAQRKVMKTL